MAAARDRSCDRPRRRSTRVRRHPSIPAARDRSRDVDHPVAGDCPSSTPAKRDRSCAGTPDEKQSQGRLPSIPATRDKPCDERRDREPSQTAGTSIPAMRDMTDIPSVRNSSSAGYALAQLPILHHSRQTGYCLRPRRVASHWSPQLPLCGIVRATFAATSCSQTPRPQFPRGGIGLAMRR